LFFTYPSPPALSTLSLHDALPISMLAPILKGWHQYYGRFHGSALKPVWRSMNLFLIRWQMRKYKRLAGHKTRAAEMLKRLAQSQDRKSTRLNSSHVAISYAVFCLK